MKKAGFEGLKEFLDEKYRLYNRPDFIPDDPVSIPHRFSKKQDIEIAGFLTATIAWGQRPVILKNALRLMKLMDNDPHKFVLHSGKKDILSFNKFTHRTFNGTDTSYFIKALIHIYKSNDSLGSLFARHVNDGSDTDYFNAINKFREIFFSRAHEPRTQKHFASPAAGSAAKRINMFLRWMIRKDKAGVDFGIWNLSPALLTCPLDVHSSRIARKLGLLSRKQNDWKAATELTNNLRHFDVKDPVKYDFALFGLGVSEKF